MLEQGGGEIKAMIGDTNLFLSTDQDTGELRAEVEIMIAEESARGRGLGWEATLIMLQYGLDSLGIQTFVAKIGMDNARSIRMFEKLQFREESRSDVFQEITFTRERDSALISLLETTLPAGVPLDIQTL